MGLSFGMQLRELDAQLQAVTQKLMSDVLYYRKMKKLSFPWYSYHLFHNLLIFTLNHPQYHLHLVVIIPLNLSCSKPRNPIEIHPNVTEYYDPITTQFLSNTNHNGLDLNEFLQFDRKTQ